VVDEGSTNGTWINGERLERHQGRRMIDGDILRLGRTCLVFREAELGERPRQVDVTADELASQASPRGLRTMSPALEREFALAAKIARSTAPVAILGETGTGKELTALAIHELSQRRGRFVAVNCAGIPEQLVASEMFGHRKGAHSLALTDRDGLVRESDKGTLFLDEIGDLPLPIQATLLRTLQDGTVRPLGSTRDEKVDLRVVCATHVDVPGLIVRARFREDLWGRLAGHVLRLPALRHRREDLGLLMRDILTRSATAAAPTLSVEAIDVITSHAWPRNIRQLEHALKRALTLANGEITIDDLPDDVSVATEDERDRLVDLLRIHRGNLPAVAAAEGVTRQAIEKRCKKHGVDYKAFRDGTAPAAALPEDAARADEP
jgi:DNA-binding NtrC family response regulator